jgi:hypothetical protein
MDELREKVPARVREPVVVRAWCELRAKVAQIRKFARTFRVGIRVVCSAPFSVLYAAARSVLSAIKQPFGAPKLGYSNLHHPVIIWKFPPVTQKLQNLYKSR